MFSGHFLKGHIHPPCCLSDLARFILSLLHSLSFNFKELVHSMLKIQSLFTCSHVISISYGNFREFWTKIHLLLSYKIHRLVSSDAIISICLSNSPKSKYLFRNIQKYTMVVIDHHMASEDLEYNTWMSFYFNGAFLSFFGSLTDLSL